MIQYDVFNGDADGICALQQLRLCSPTPDARLITGVKRDISLLKRITAQSNDHVTVLDISLEKNLTALLTLLDKGVKVCYFDHHFAGDIPNHPGLDAHINTQADTCTSLIVNNHLANQHWLWAATGAFGDNFDQSARNLIQSQSTTLKESDIDLIRKLGVYINYNAYGETVADLHITPKDLFLAIQPYSNPIDFINSDARYQLLEHGYQEDMAKATLLTPKLASETHALFILPSEAWARRVSGVYANNLAQTHPKRAHALLTELENNNYLVSVRAPLATKEGADDLCRQFETGGGRKAAAGINCLPATSLSAFIEAFKAIYP